MAKPVRRIQRKLKPKHRAVKPRPVRPLDAKPDNHAARHEAKKQRRAEHERLMMDQAHDAALREDARQTKRAEHERLMMDQAHDAALREDARPAQSDCVGREVEPLAR